VAEPDAPSDEDTLTDVLAHYASEGFDANFSITEDGLVRCPKCRHEMEPDQLILHGLRRLEGASDPDDMLAVLVIECPHCGARGTAVARFGPGMSEGEAIVLRTIEDRRDPRMGGIDPTG
jgi:DNA-directed RNA polymerase subunit RPC12/RpoP